MTETHCDEILLCPIHSSEESSQHSVCSDSRTDSRHFHQATALIKFAYFRDKLGVAENTSLAEREC
jgi:hypothetical protein